jgi:hypothetical protein
MDVNITNTIPYSIPRSGDITDNQIGRSLPGKKPEISLPFAKDDSISEKVRDQFVMSLQDVQNFLYMMIGSKIRLQSENDSLGSTVNTAA